MIRTGVCVVAALWLVWSLWRHLAGDRRPVSIVVAGAVLLGAGWFEVRWRLDERALTAAASSLVGRDVKVHCQRTAGFLLDISGYMGYVPYPADGADPIHVYLRNDTCRSLAAWRRDPGSLAPEHVAAVHVLTHEAMHLGGTRNEARAECAAMQRDAQTARLLGADPDTAQRLPVAYYATSYPRLRADYRSPRCVRDGPWDEGLPDPPWPPGGAAEGVADGS